MFTQCRPWTRCPGAESSCTYSQLPGTTSDNLQYRVGQFKTGTHEVKGGGERAQVLCYDPEWQWLLFPNTK